MRPKPNYYLCSDTDDTVQLTDGVAKISDWFRKTSVGWSNIKEPVLIEIDLEKPSFVEDMVFHTIGGGVANVEYPLYIAAFGSLDGNEYYSMGLLDNRSLSSSKTNQRQKKPLKISINGINLNARYIRLLLMLNGAGSHFFLDEIEVLGQAKKNIAPVSSHHKKLTGPFYLVDMINRQLQIKDTADNILNEVKRAGNVSDQCSQLVREVNHVVRPLTQAKTGLYSKAKLDDEFDRLSVLRSKIYKILYNKDFACYPSNPMDVLRSESFLVEGVKKINDPVEMSLWQNEYESASINVINCTEKKQHYNISVSPVSDPNGHVLLESPVTLRKSVYVYASTAGYIGDPLVLAGNGIDLMPGQAGQLWITWHSKNTLPGQYRFSLAISPEMTGGDHSITTIPVNVSVHPKYFPDKLALNTCNWAYTSVSYAVGPNIKEAAKDLQSHYTNVYPVNHNIMPWPKKVYKAGRTEIKKDFTRFDAAIRDHDYSSTFLIYLKLRKGSKFRDFFGKNWMSSDWKRSFSLWLKDIVGHLNAMGVDYDRFALYPFDEQLGDDFYDLAKVIKRIDPRIRIYANSFGKGPGDFMKLRDYVDIWCFQVSHCLLHPNWLTTVRTYGKPVWMYEALAPAKSFSPYAYYRLMPWQAFKLGLTGTGFWTYANHYKIPSWDDTGVPKGSYNVVYKQYNSPVDTRGERFIPSRRWEAFREGIEDYQYLSELKKMIALNISANPQKAKQAQQILDSQVDHVLQNNGDPDIVYQARKKIAEILSGLIVESGR